jgi:uncharacterized membrane protein
MSRKPILVALGVSLAAFTSMPATAADLGCHRVKLTCSGFEPNWAFRLNPNSTIRFTDPENANGGVPPIVIPACAKRLPGHKIDITAGAPLGLSATVTQHTCTEPSGQTRPYSIAISYTQGATGSMQHQVSGTGCCHH